MSRDRRTVGAISQHDIFSSPSRYIQGTPVTPEMVVESLIALERISRRVREDRGLPEPVKYEAKH